MWDSLTGKSVDTLALQEKFARLKVAATITKRPTLTGALNDPWPSKINSGGQ